MNFSKAQNWKSRYYLPATLWFRSAILAPNKILESSNRSGKFELYSRDLNKKSLNQITDREQGTLFGSLSPSGKFVYFLEDNKGRERGHFVRIPFDESKKTERIDITPDLPEYFGFDVSSDKNDKNIVFGASLDGKNKVCLVSFDKERNSHKTDIVYESESLIGSPIISLDGSLTCFTVSLESKDPSHKLIIFDNNSKKIIFESVNHFNGNFFALTFSSDKNKLLCISNNSGTYQPFFFDWKTNLTEKIDAGLSGDVFVLDWLENEKQMLLCSDKSAKHQLSIFHTDTKKCYLIGPTNGSYDVSFNYASFINKDSVIVKWQSFNNPGLITQLDSPEYKPENLDGFKKDTDSKRKLKEVYIKSSDGENVQIWFALPDNSTNPKPFVIDIHGGPHGIIRDEFLPAAHAWLDKGFGYCAVNYRGSVGFGKDFEKKIYGNPGYWEVEDVVATRKWLVESNMANESQIFLYGWSWGGYVSLLAAGKYPSLWRAVIAGASIADTVMQYEDGPSVFQALDREYFGGTPTEVPEIYSKASPSSYVKDISAPILLLHGRNDVRCPPRQIEHFVELLKLNNKDFEIIWSNSGHVGGFANIDLRVSNMNHVFKFAEKNKKALRFEKTKD